MELLDRQLLSTERMRCACHSRVRDKRVGRIHFARKRAVPMGCGVEHHVSNRERMGPVEHEGHGNCQNRVPVLSFEGGYVCYDAKR